MEPKVVVSVKFLLLTFPFSLSVLITVANGSSLTVYFWMTALGEWGLWGVVGELALPLPLPHFVWLIMG